MAVTPLHVLLVDDSAIFRKVLKTVLGQDARFQIVGAARNGEEALQIIEQSKPDAMVLDVEMPIMDGLETLQAVKKRYTDIEVIMFSSLTKAGAEITFQALEYGAFDFVAKPEANSITGGLASVQSDLIPKLTFLHTRKTLRSVSASTTTPTAARKEATRKIEPPVKPAIVPPHDAQRHIQTVKPLKYSKKRIVGLGISTGGPRALATMMAKLPGNLETGLLIVQHMPPVFTHTLAQRLNELSPLEVKEAEENDIVRPGLALIAPGGRHMTVEKGSRITDPVRIRLNDDPPEHNCRPSVDVLFRSIAEVYGAEAVGVIMTGMGSDGTPGLRLMKSKGAYVIAQNEESCTVFGMPKKPIEEGLSDVVVPLEEIAGAITGAVANKGNKP